jgi:hypothetical protein
MVAQGTVPGRLAPAGWLDLIPPTLLALLMAGAAFGLAEGDVRRTALVLPGLLWAPGYAALEAAIVPAAPVAVRLRHAALALGLSVPAVGLLALLTAYLPGGFRAGTLVATVALATVALAGIAGIRRAAWSARLPVAQPQPAPPHPAPQPARQAERPQPAKPAGRPARRDGQMESPLEQQLH